MWKIKNVFMNADAGGDAGGAGAEQQPAEQDNQGGNSLLSTDGAGAEQQTADVDFIPEKYRANGEDGKFSLQESARKLADAYTHLEKRFGSGDAPPKTADEYAPKIEAEGFNWEEFKGDPEMQGFLKAAHAKGITNDQMGFILGEYMQRASGLVGGAAELDADAARTELRETWKTDGEFNKNLGLAFRAFNNLADPADKGKMDEIGNNPMVIRMLAKIGAEMGEDSPAGGSDPQEQQAIKDLMKSEAYTNPKHADHERVSAQVRAFYQKNYGDQPVA